MLKAYFPTPSPDPLPLGVVANGKQYKSTFFKL